MKRIVKVKSITAAGISLEATFEGVSFSPLNELPKRVKWRSCTMTSPVVIESPSFLSVIKAQSWIETLTDEMKQIALVSEKVAAPFKALEGATEV
jgi:hypothetical protein